MLAEVGILEAIYMQTDDCMAAVKSGSLLESRRSVDKLRQLRAVFARFASVSEGFKSPEVYMTDIAPSLEVVVRAINENLEVIERTFSDLLSGLQQADCETEEWHRFLDRSLPLRWNWEGDIIFLNSPPNEIFRRVLIERGQKRVVYLESAVGSQGGTIQSDSATLDNSCEWKGVHFIPFSDKVLLEEAFSEWSLVPPELVTHIFLESDDQSDDHGALQILQDMATVAGAGRNTSLAFSRVWIRQQYENSKHVCRGYTHADLLGLLSGRDVIIVSPGPSLGKNIELLSRGSVSAVIIAVAQACPALKRHGIRPDFVIFSDPGDYAALIDDIFAESTFGLIINSVCHPGFFRLRFPRLFPIMSSICVNGLELAFPQESMELFGGSVSINAFSLCIKAGARSVALVGQDLSFGERIYYDRPGWNEDISLTSGSEFFEINGIRQRIFKTRGYHGGYVNTKPDYWVYLQQFADIAVRDCNRVWICNCTEGGAYINGFENISLQQYIASLDGKGGSLDVHDISISEVDRRERVLVGVFERQLEVVREASWICSQIIPLLHSVDVGSFLDEISSLEKRLMTLTASTLPLHFLMQRALLTFSARSDQTKTFFENIRLSEELYQDILIECAVLDGYIVGALRSLSGSS